MRAARLAAAAAAVAALGAVAGAGCLRSTSFTCATDGECAVGGAGTCEDVGYCSFPDDGCRSGRRFGDGAGPFAGDCVSGPADLDGGADAANDARLDAAADATGTVGCLEPGNGTTFPPGGACNGWGTAFSTAAMVQNAGGRLTITPASNLVTAGGCVHAAVPFAAPGVLADVDRTIQGASARTLLELEGTGLAIGVEDSTMVARAGGAVIASAPFTLPTMRWWRMRPDAGGVVFEVSADGLAWAMLGRTALAAPASAPIRVVAETMAGEPAPGSARFLAVNLCP